MKHVGIIGGGASGMMAAIAAAMQGARVTILEKRDRIGKKILATGNGKCNLSNRDFCVPRDYRSHDIKRLDEYFEQFGQKDTEAFFISRGMLLTDKDGYLYPRSAQASTVLDFLMGELKRLGVAVFCNVRILSIKYTAHSQKGNFQVKTDTENYNFDRLILAAGSNAGTKASEELGGISLAKSMGLGVYEMLPALTALRCQEKFTKIWAGVRCRGKITLHIEGSKKVQEIGELQMTDYGISGIPVFQCSRYAAEALTEGKKVKAEIDFMPEYSAEEWKKLCETLLASWKGKEISLCLNGLLPKKIVQVLMGSCHIKIGEKAEKSTRTKLFSALEMMRSFSFSITGINTAESAQVCAGGVAIRQLDKTLQAKNIPGFYLCGEILDVDGRCGGYNLQWAWSSGYIAGLAAGKE